MGGQPCCLPAYKKIGIIRIADYFPENNGIPETVTNVCGAILLPAKTKEVFDDYIAEEAKNGNHQPDISRSIYNEDENVGLIYYEGEPESNRTEISGTIVDIPKEMVRIEVPTTAGTLDAEYFSCESEGIVIGFKPKGEDEYFVDVALAEVKGKELCESRGEEHSEIPDRHRDA